MDHYSRCSAVQPVATISLAKAVVTFENLLLAQFWSPHTVRDDLAFRFDEFNLFLTQYNIEYSPVSPRRYYKNLLAPKHAIIRAIYLCLKDAPFGSNSELLAVSATLISNEM